MATKRYVVLLSIIMFVVGTKALAYDFELKNADGVTIYYNIINETELAITAGYGYSGSVVIPEEVTYMDKSRKVTSIGYGAFSNCTELTSVTIPNSVKSIEGEAFRYCSGLTSVTIPNSVESIGTEAFFWCSSLNSISIGNSVKSIGDMAFYCSGLTSVTIPNSVTSIGGAAFLWCRGLTSVTIPNNLTSINGRVFEGCKLSSVTIPNSVTSIGSGAFRDCNNLTSVTIPKSVTNIEDLAFYGVDLAEVISRIENPFNIYSNTFSSNTYQNATLYVPTGAIDKYKAKEGWRKFDIIENGENGETSTEQSKCEKPTIAYKNGKLVFSCATEGVTYQYNISTSIKSGEGNNIDFTPKFTITAYATKDGYENSETATLEVSIGDANCDGIINAADITTIVNIIMGQ